MASGLFRELEGHWRLLKGVTHGSFLWPRTQGSVQGSVRQDLLLAWIPSRATIHDGLLGGSSNPNLRRSHMLAAMENSVWGLLPFWTSNRAQERRFPHDCWSVTFSVRLQAYTAYSATFRQWHNDVESALTILGPEGRVPSQKRCTVHRVTWEARKTPGLLLKNIPEIWGGVGGGERKGTERQLTPGISPRGTLRSSPWAKLLGWYQVRAD